VQRGLATTTVADEGYVADSIRGLVHARSPLSRRRKNPTLQLPSGEYLPSGAVERPD
jgi:hypothetical protein